MSWTGFVIATLARAVAQYPQSNARRAGNRVLFFDGVDVGATVERQTDGGVVPVVVTIRDAGHRSCAVISAELRRARQAPDQAPARRGAAARGGAPARAGPQDRHAACRPEICGRGRVLAWGVPPRSGYSPGGWAIPIAPLPWLATVIGVVDRPVVRDGQIVARPMLPLTLSFDHGVIDGVPAARFVPTLRDLTETAAAFERTR